MGGECSTREKEERGKYILGWKTQTGVQGIHFTQE